MTTPGAVPGRRAPFLSATCSCGRALAIPLNLTGRRVKCPACGGWVAAPRIAQAGIPVADPATLRGITCSVCLGRFEEGAGAVGCPSCTVAYHSECWEENGGCGVFGCPFSPVVVKEDTAEEGPVQTAWGDTKTCPQCRKEIQAIAIKCRFCKADFGTRDPVSPQDWKDRKRRQGTGGRTRTMAVLAFLASATCVALPLGASLSLYHLLDRGRRADLDDADRFLFMAAAAIAGLYLVLYGLFKVVGW